jgi:hypothetical protein
MRRSAEQTRLRILDPLTDCFGVKDFSESRWTSLPASPDGGGAVLQRLLGDGPRRFITSGPYRASQK